MDNLESISKAIAGGIAGLLIAELSRYGFHPQPVVVDALGVVMTAIVGYVAGHVVVWAAPANKPRILP
jgi:hypothetical protein